MMGRALAIAAALAASAALLIPQSAGDDDTVLRAMRDELDRSRQLRVVAGGDDLPYFISYTVSDQENFSVSAAQGALVNLSHSRYRAPNIEVRVGSYDFDHTGHIFSGFYSGSRYDTESWPLDDDYAALRDGLWLGTDRAYKAALESIARKRAALNSTAAPTEKLADFSPAQPVKSIAKISHKKVDEAAWTSRVEKLTGVFNSYPEILSSGAEFQVIAGTTYLANSEGTMLRYPDDLATVFARAEGQAPDGMLLSEAVSFQALEADELPAEAELRQAFAGIAEDIRARVRAPAGESFSGPVLFEPLAAAQLFAQLLGDNLRRPRKPLAEAGRPVNFLPSELETRMGSRILPEWIDVVDDPTQTSWQGKPLAGYYPFDLEGVAPKAVPVVQKGVVKSFLTTRQPLRGSAAGSNGHARLPGQYGTRNAAIGNLFVKASETSPLADLKKKLIDMVQERGMPYGMLVRKLDYPFSAGSSELQTLAQSSSQAGGSVRPVSPPVLVYRVYPDGREELVRGLRFRGVSTRSLRDILAASQETALFDYVNNAAPLAMLGAGGYLAPAAVVSPALLFDELELERPQDQLPKPPIVPPPSVKTQ
jgi:TldD protein